MRGALLYKPRSRPARTGLGRRAGRAAGGGAGARPALGPPQRHAGAWLLPATPADAQQLPDPWLDHVRARLTRLLVHGRMPRCCLRSAVQGCLTRPAFARLATFLLVYVLYAVAVARPGHGSIGPLSLGLAIFAIISAGGRPGLAGVCKFALAVSGWFSCNKQ